MNKKLRILIVDDEPGMRETLSDILADRGHEVETAEDGARAIELIKKKFYDLTFIDIKMPGINGVETFKHVKRISPETMVVMMTAYSMKDLIKEALQEGAYGILYKPLDMDKVISVVNESSLRKNKNG